MAWRSSYEVTPLQAALLRRSPRQVVRAPSPPRGLETPVGQSLDDMIDEIRRLRANVLPRGLHPEVLQNDSTEDFHLSPGSDVTAASGAELSNSKWLTPSPGASSHRARRVPVSPVRRPSPLRPTLWEERQLRRCLRQWRAECHRPGALVRGPSRSASVHRAFASEDHLPPAMAPSAASRLDRCWHAWRRLVQTDHAGELELSVQLLHMQMARSQRRSLSFWHRWAQRRPGRNDRRRFRSCTRRLALQRWRSAVESQRQWQAMNDQAMSLLRISALRRTLQWLRGQKGLKEDEEIQRQRKMLAQQSHVRRCLFSSLATWVRFASLNRRVQQGQQLIAKRHAREALQRLRRFLRERKGLQLVLTMLQLQKKARQRSRKLQQWQRWCRTRRQREVQLQGHLHNCLEPRLLRRLLLLWATWTRQEQRNQATLQKAHVVLNLSLKSRSFHAWLQRQKGVQKAASCLRGLADVLALRSVAVVLELWRLAQLQMVKERAALDLLTAGLEKLLQRGTLHAWLANAHLVRRHGEILQTVHSARGRSLLAHALAQWHRKCRKSRYAETKLQGLQGDMQRCFLVHLWDGWLRLTARMRQALHLSQLQKRRGSSRILQRWLGLFRAGEGHRQQLTVLKARVWNAWLGRTIHSMEVAHQRISHGIARRKGFLLQAAISWWVQALERIREFKVLVPVLMDTLSEACLAHGQRQMYGTWRRWWRWVEEGRRADDEELLYISFHSWLNGSVEQRHKRGVHLLCERYRDVRMKRKTLFAWKRRVERLTSVMNSVELWAANSYSQHALRVLAAWHGTCRRRLRARQGQQLLMQRRRAALLNSWHLLMLRNITAEGVAEAVLQSRALQWLHAWKAWASAHARRREGDEVKTAFVRQSRQRWGIERWCSAGRFRRLVDVAEKWDGQVLCKQLVLRAFTGWSAMMGLYACGEKVAAAVGARRAKRMLRHWSFLLLVGEKRPHQLMRQIMARWRLFLQRCSEVQRGLERLGRWTMGPTFRRFVAYVQDRKQRRQNVSSHGSRLQSSGQRRAQASALTWWRRCVREVLQERRLDERNGHTAEEDLQRRERVTMLRQRATLDLWREALLFHKAALWQEIRPRLVMAITGQSMLQTAFRALARRSVHRRKARRAQEAVQAKLSESRLLRSFDHWAKAFEMESSSFFASRILGRSKLKRILLRWKQHTNFRAGFATQVVKTLQNLELQRLQRSFDAWKQRPHLRHLAAGMWLLRRKTWISACFMAWKEEALKAAARRRHLRYFHRQVKFNKARRAGKVQRKHSHATLLRKVFKAYAAWVKRARSIQARAKHLGTELCLARKAQRLGSWAAHCRAFHVSSKRATQVFNAWLTQARREKTLSWASRSLASDQLRRAGQEGLRKLRSWCIFRRTLRAMMAGRRQTLLSSVLYCWVAALLPARHAMTELQHRARARLLQLFDAWARQGRQRGARKGQAEAMRLRCGLQGPREVIVAWFQHRRKLMAARRLCLVLDRADARWIGEEEWMRKALADQHLQAMFRRFAQALDQHSTPSQGSIVLRGAFQSVLALVWARQQLSVVLGRLRGYFQPWFLGCWPQSKWPLLSPEDPYFMQAEIRLRVMMSQLDAVRAQEQVPSLFKLMQDSDALRQPNSRRVSWQALADLLVVHHPGWPSQVPPFQPVEPVAKGVTPLAPHFGRLEQRAWLLPFSGCGDTAGGPVTWCYDSGSESAVSFGTPAFGSGDQAAGVLA